MKRSSGPRKTANLSESVQKQLSMYALAASAAGVGVLACSSPAAAEIVFTSTFVQIAPGAVVNVDLNGDGIADFQFSNYIHQTDTFGHLSVHGRLKVLPQNQSNAIYVAAGASASALPPGVVVGSKGQFEQSGFMAYAFYYCTNPSCVYRSNGPWKEASRLYLGLRFTIQGQTHFGWARLNAAATSRGVYAAVTGYAYETVPNRSIVTGQTKGAAKKKNVNGVRHSNPRSLNPSTPKPASLGLLARGSLGLDAWRRRDAACQ